MSTQLAKKILISTLFVLGLAAPAYAVGIWFEPYAGYEIADREVANTSYDATGLNFGLRLGVSNSSLFFGVEYALADLDIDIPNNNHDVRTNDLGLFLGTEFSMVRLWFVYWLDSKGDHSNSSVEYSGDGGYKIGLGFKIFSQASLNIEKTLRVWKDSDGTPMSNKIEIDGILISMSLPLKF